MESDKDYFFYFMIILNAVANTKFNVGEWQGESASLGFDFSTFIIVLIFILIARKLYKKA